jgi:ribonuclease P protein component
VRLRLREGELLREALRLRLREALRLTAGAHDLAGYHLVLIAREATPTRDWPLLLADLRGALKQTGVLP